MAQPQIIYGIAVPVSAGDDGARVIQSTMKLAGLIAAVMTVSFIVDMADHASRIGSEFEPAANEWAGTVIGFLICGLAVPFFGWWGAKNKDQTWLSAFCIGEGCVGGCSAIGLITTWVFAAMGANWACGEGEGTSDCKAMFDAGNSSCTVSVPGGWGRGGQTVTIEKTYCDNPYGHWHLYVTSLLLIVMTVLGIWATIKSSELKNLLVVNYRRSAPAGQTVVSTTATVVMAPQPVQAVIVSQPTASASAEPEAPKV